MIFQEIEAAHKTLTGWTSWQKAEALASAVIALRPAISVEIGVWAGRSFIPMAMAHKHIGHGTAWAIDPWSHASSTIGQVNPADVEWWSKQERHEFAYKQFSTRIVELALQNSVNIQRLPSDMVVPPKDIGLLHIDGNHGEQSIRDVSRFVPNVIPGGLLILDDLEWSGGSVMQSASLAIEHGFKELFAIKDSVSQNTWAVYQKTT